jgi:putative membrane protein
MRQQWIFVSALVFAIIIAIFSVVNVDAVPVDFIFVGVELPMILVILGSALAGGLVVGIIGTVRYLEWRQEMKELKLKLQDAEHALAQTHRSEASSNTEQLNLEEKSIAPEQTQPSSDDVKPI